MNTASVESHPRVLVVDDNEDAADSLATLLGVMGYEVRTAYDGPEAITAADEFQPAVALLDIGLPQLSGYDIARHVRELAVGWRLQRNRDRPLHVLGQTCAPGEGERKANDEQQCAHWSDGAVVRGDEPYPGTGCKG